MMEEEEEEETDVVKLLGLTVHPPTSEVEVDTKVFPGRRTSTGDLPEPEEPAPGGIQLPCGHTLDNCNLVLCRKIVLKECARGHVVRVTCNRDMSKFKCKTVVEMNAKCAAGEHPLKAPCHLAGKLDGLTPRGRTAVYIFPPCQEPFEFKCKRRLHLKSVPCYQRAWPSKDKRLPCPSPCPPPPPPPPPPSVEAIQDDVKAFVESDEGGREEPQAWLSRYIPRVVLPPSSISVLIKEGMYGLIGKLLDRLEEEREMITMTHLVKTSSVLNFLLSQWKPLADPKTQQMGVWERIKKLVQIYHTDFIATETGSKRPCKDKELQDTFNSIFRQWCGSWVESAGVVISEMGQLLSVVDHGRENRAIAMYELILQLSETFLQSVSENPLHSDEGFCVELVKESRYDVEKKRAVVWTLLGILATLKDPSTALDIGKCCVDVISGLLEDFTLLYWPTRLRPVVDDDEVFAWKTVLKSVFPRPSDMMEINGRIKDPDRKAEFIALELDNPTRKEFRDFYHPPASTTESGEGGLLTLDILKVEPISSTTQSEENPTHYIPAQVVGCGVDNSGSNGMPKRRSDTANSSSTGKRTKM